MTNEQLPLIEFNKPERPDVQEVELSRVLEWANDQLQYAPAPTSDLIKSIKDFGMLDPVKFTQLDNGRLRLEAGRRRILAAKILELETIPIQIYIVDSTTGNIISIHDNNTRKENPLSDFMSLISIMDDFDAAGKSYNEKDLANAVGLSIGRVRKLMTLSNLNNALMRKVTDKKLSVTKAMKLSKLPKRLQQQAAKKLNDNNKLTNDDIDELKRTRARQAVATFDFSEEDFLPSLSPSLSLLGQWIVAIDRATAIKNNCEDLWIETEKYLKGE